MSVALGRRQGPKEEAMSGYDVPDKEQHNPVSGTTPRDPKTGTHRWPVRRDQKGTGSGDMKRPGDDGPVDEGSASDPPADANEIADERARIVEP
ncbi:MAG TPA: hypothetical protein VHK89_07510 [Actinomycetota bacterium]|nr:hypothetical protein [Actinomycetota bacterium]